jgi:hypothetical protein
LPFDTPWRFADRAVVQRQAAQRFRDRADAITAQNNIDTWKPASVATTADARLSAPPPTDTAHQGSSFWGGLGSLAKDVAGETKDLAGQGLGKAMDILSMPYEYGGKQIAGVVTGAAGMPRKAITDAQGNVVGYKREGGQGIGDWLSNVGTSIQHPGRAGNAYEEYLSSLPAAGQIGGRIAADPLSWVGEGAVKGVLGAGAASKGGKLAAWFLENPANATRGAVLGSMGAGQLAESTGHPNWVGPASLIGGLAGGIVATKIPATGELVGKARTAAGKAAEATGVANAWKQGAVPGAGMVSSENPHLDLYLKDAKAHGLDIAVDEKGNYFFSNPDAADQAAQHALDSIVPDITNEHIAGAPGWKHYAGDNSVQNPNNLDTPAEHITYDADGTQHVPNTGSVAPQNARYSATPSTHDTWNQAERINEMNAAGVVDPAIEAARQPWAADVSIPGYKPLAETELDALRARYAEVAHNSTEGMQIAQQLGANEAHQFMAARLTPDHSPASLARDIQGELDAIEVHHAIQTGPNSGKITDPVKRAYFARLKEADAHLTANGRDAAILPGNERVAASPNEVSGGAAGVPPVGTREQTVKYRDIFGNEHDTYATEAELNGVRAGQGAMPGLEGEPPKPTENAARAGQGALPEEPTQPPADLALTAQEPQARAGQGTPLEEPARANQGQLPPTEPHAGPPPPLDRTNPHSILGLDPTGTYSEADIRTAYRRAARMYHPDLNANESATADMQAINKAFEDMMRGTAGPRASYASEPAWQAAQNQRASQARDWADQTAREEVPQWKAEKNAEQARWDIYRQENGPGGGGHGRGTAPIGPATAPQGVDLFAARPLATAQAQANTLGGRIRRVLTGSSNPIDAFKQELNRTNEIINGTAAIASQKVAEMQAMGLRTAVGSDGQFRMVDLPGQPVAADVIRQSTPQGKAAFLALSPEQQAKISDYAAFNDTLNRNLLFHTGDIPQMRDMEGVYFPTVVTGKDGVKKVFLGGSRAVGAKQGFQHELVNQSVEEGIAKGFDFADMGQSAEVGARGKMRVAQDAYLTSLAKPMGRSAAQLPEGSVIGITHLAVPGVPSLSGTFFEPALAKEISDSLTTSRQPLGVVGAAQAVNRVLTPVRASTDFSAVGQQEMALWVTHPIQALKNTVTMIRSLKDDKIYTDAVAARDAAGPGIQQHVTWGGHFTPDANAGEFSLPSVPGASKAAAVINKVAQKSNQAFARTTNLARLDLGNVEFDNATKVLHLTGDALQSHMEAAWKSINRETGWTRTNLTQTEKALAFAPKYTRANLEQLAAAFTKGDVEGKIAREHLLKLVGVAAGVTIAANELRGYDTSVDPRSYNFLRIRNVAGQDVSILGPFSTLVRAMAISVAGNATDMGGAETKTGVLGLTYGSAKPKPNPYDSILGPSGLLRSKAAPAVGILWDVFSGSNFQGEPIGIRGPGEIKDTLIREGKTLAPFSVQALVNEGPAGAITSATGLQSSPMTPAERRGFARDQVAGKAFGGSYDTLSAAQKAQVNADPKVAALQKEAESNTLTRDNTSAQMLKATNNAGAQLDALSQELQTGQISGNDFRDQYTKIQDQLRGARDVLTKADNSGTVGGWFALYDQATLPDGRLDTNTLDGLQSAYEAKHPTIQADLLKAVGVHDNPTMQEYRQAKAQAAEYYALPLYAGWDPQDAWKASDILQRAQAMVTYGQARNTKGALSMIGTQDPEGAMLAMRAQKATPNPERKLFRMTHPLLGKFYSDLLAQSA